MGPFRGLMNAAPYVLIVWAIATALFIWAL